MPVRCRMRAFDRDLIRGGHYGQRSCEPHLKAEHMAAPTNAANVKKALANSEPSTHYRTVDFRGAALASYQGHCERHTACPPVSSPACKIKPLGVGLNLLPHAVRDLAQLGLEDQYRRQRYSDEGALFLYQSRSADLCRASWEVCGLQVATDFNTSRRSSCGAHRCRPPEAWLRRDCTGTQVRWCRAGRRRWSRWFHWV